MIYLDNAATTLKKPDIVYKAVLDAMKNGGNSGRGTYGAALEAANTVFSARKRIAAFFNAERANNVAFTSGATEALNTAIFGLVPYGSEPVHIITTECEHNSVLRPLYKLESQGRATVSFAKADRLGRINPDDIESLVRPSTRFIVTTHASNLTGNLIGIKSIAGIARRHGLVYIVDASQTAGSIPIDMRNTGIDILCFTGHKGLLGPQGTGGIVVRDGIHLEPLKTGGTGVKSYSKSQPEEMPTLLEAGTLNSHGIAGLSAAIGYIEETGLLKLGKKEESLAERLYRGLSDIEGVEIYGDFSCYERQNSENPEGGGKKEAETPMQGRMPIVAFNVKDAESGEVSDILAEEFGIASRPGAHCAPLMHKALGTEKQGAVRFSISHSNTESDIDEAVDAVRQIASEF